MTTTDTITIKTDNEINLIQVTCLSNREKIIPLISASSDLLTALLAYQNTNPLHNDADFKLYDLAKEAIDKAIAD